MARHINDPKFKLEDAISNYDYPAAYFDFTTGTDVTHDDGMTGIEYMLHGMLRSGVPAQVEHGLANVIHWAFARDHRLRPIRRADFIAGVTPVQINDFITLVSGGRTPDLQEFFALGFPVFSGIATASKVLMFLDPSTHVTLDSKIAKIQYEPTNPNRAVVDLSIGQLRNTAANRQAYVDWCKWCCDINDRWFDGNKRAADIERGMFQLASEGNLDLARGMYQNAL
jgi:hypothetical protein